jgi:hypothetical protein
VAVQGEGYERQGICVTLLCLLAVNALAEEKTISQDGVSLTYDKSTFSKIEIISRFQVVIRILADPGDCPSAEPTTRNANTAIKARFICACSYHFVIAVWRAKEAESAA